MTRFIELPGKVLVHPEAIRVVEPIQASGRHHTRIEFRGGGFREIRASYSDVKRILQGEDDGS